ncbi:hypothetical protein [Legionella sp. 16cNR16C]|uniref:hypothetical protein n=1 Tax=Legionella sp. 16cNR16C TaxID=2905656 RepID=UPI001E2F4BA1|nr:hypothetical protein [Legionella sp. 16cNR16C]MCE3045885.1 hypothetical protein [Legionella sp. 16cNR16C]
MDDKKPVNVQNEEASSHHQGNYQTEKPGEITKKSQGPKGNQIPEPDQKKFNK